MVSSFAHSFVASVPLPHSKLIRKSGGGGTEELGESKIEGKRTI